MPLLRGLLLSFHVVGNSACSSGRNVFTLQIFTAGGVPIVWDDQQIAEQVDPRTNSFITRENLDSVLVRGSHWMMMRCRSLSCCIVLCLPSSLPEDVSRIS